MNSFYIKKNYYYEDGVRLWYTGSTILPVRMAPWAPKVVEEPPPSPIELGEKAPRPRPIRGRKVPRIGERPFAPSEVRWLLPDWQQSRGGFRAAPKKEVPEEVKAKRPAFIYIAGVKCPPLAKLAWKPYIRKQGETLVAWRKRVKSLAAGWVDARKTGAAMRREELWHELPLEDKITTFLQETGEARGRYDVLANRVEASREGVWPGLPRDRKSLGKIEGPKTNWAFNFIEARLEAKLRLSQYQDEWREARFLRREKRLARKQEVLGTSSSPFELLSEKIEAQMDSAKDVDAQGAKNEKPAVSKKSNVVLQDQRDASYAKPFVSSQMSEFVCMSCEKTKISSENLSNRWITIHNGKWVKSLATNRELYSVSLPYDVLKKKEIQNSPNLAMFMQNTYWRGDIVIKVLINSNARQYGQLQCSFYYGAEQDLNFGLRTDMFTSSQQPHTLLTANFSNSAEMVIPYHYIFPLLKIKDITKNSGSIGVFKIRVVVPLNMASTTQTSCTYSVMFATEKNQFFGMISRSIIGNTGEVNSILHNVVDLVTGDPNRDNPPRQQVGSVIYPQNVGSWCAGTGCGEWINTLRLTPNRMLPSMGRGTSENEMLVKYIASIYGMIGIYPWTDQLHSGALIKKFDAAPLGSFASYPRVSIKGTGEPCRQLPPVAILSSLFAYWRGSLELRIDIVGCVELTGRLQVSYVPRHYADIDMATAIQCPSEIFDLQEKRQFIFKIPFLADKPVWPTKFSYTNNAYFDNVLAPGSVYIFVYNDLIANSTIPSDCQLVVYMRGGEDFEVLVPATPLFGLSFNNVINYNKSTKNEVFFKPGYYPTNLGSWRYFYVYIYQEDMQKYAFENQACIVRYGDTTDHIAQMLLSGIKKEVLDEPLSKTNPNPKGCIPIVPLDGVPKHTYSYKDESGATKSSHVTFYLLYPSGENFATSDYIYLVPCCKFTPAQWMNVIDSKSKPVKTRYIYYNQFDAPYGPGMILHWTSTDKIVGPFLAPVADSTTYSNFLFQEWMIPNTSQYANNFPLKFFNPLNEEVEGQMEEPKTSSGEQKQNKTVVFDITDSACATAFGSRIYGENFGDLNDYCRRYQLYSSGYIPGGHYTNSDVSSFITLKFPAMPQGLELNNDNTQEINESANRLRDGHIPVIASGFRYFYGGLRFRIILHPLLSESSSVANFKYFVSHRPNVTPIEDRVVLVDCSDLGTTDLEMGAFAFHIQSSALNDILTFEIPFYSIAEKCFLQRPQPDLEIRMASCLGEIEIGINIPIMKALKGIKYEIYYSLADDARFILFQGFPPVMDLTNLTRFTLPPVNQDYLRKEPIIRQSLWQNISSLPSIVEDSEYEEIEGQMMTSARAALSNLTGISHRVDEAINEIDMNNINATVTTARSTMNIVGNTAKNVNDLLEKFKNTFENCKEKFKPSELLDYDHILIILLDIAQIMVNPTISTIALVISKFLLTIKVITADGIKKAAAHLSKLLSEYIKPIPAEEGSAENIIYPDPPDSSIEINAEEIIGNFDEVKSQYLSLLFTGVSALVGISRDVYNAAVKKAPLPQFGANLFQTFTTAAKSGTIIIQFIKSHCDILTEMINWWSDRNPEVKHLAWLEEHGDEVFAWTKECMVLTDGRMESKVFGSIREAQKVYARAAQACSIQLRLADTRLDNVQMNTLSTLCRNITSLRDRLAKQHIAPCVKFEPFVICFAGPTEVGKSFLAQNLAIKLLNSIKYKTYNEVIYTRQSGKNAYWNGLTNQPVCLYDDFCAIEDPDFSGVQLAELFQLKTRAVFNPPMAAVEDKHLRYNPLIVILCTNNAFPKLTGLLDTSAVYRRRDVLYSVQKKLEYAGKSPEDGISAEVLANYGHLEFHKANNKLNEQTEYTEIENYEAFEKQIIAEFQSYYKREQKRYQGAMEKLTTLYPDEGEEESTFMSGEYNYERLMSEIGVSFDEVIFNRRQNLNNQNNINNFQRTAEYFKDLMKNLKAICTRTPIEAQMLGYLNTYAEDDFRRVQFNQTLWALTGIRYLDDTRAVEDMVDLSDEERSIWEALYPSQRTTVDESKRCCHWVLNKFIRDHANHCYYTKELNLWTMNYHEFCGPHVPSLNANNNYVDVYSKIFGPCNPLDDELNFITQACTLNVTQHQLKVFDRPCEAGYCCHNAVRLNTFEMFVFNDTYNRHMLNMGNFEFLERHLPSDILQRVRLGESSLHRSVIEREVEPRISWLREKGRYIWTRLKESFQNKYVKLALSILKNVGICFGVAGLLYFFDVSINRYFGSGLWESHLTSSTRNFWSGREHMVGAPEPLGDIRNPPAPDDPRLLREDGITYRYTQGMRGPNNEFIPLSREDYRNRLLPNASGDARVRGIRNRVPQVRVAGIRGQMNDQDRSIFIHKIKRNTIFLTCFYENSSKYIEFRALGICNRFALIVKHSWDAVVKINNEIEENPVIVIHTMINDLNRMEYNYNEFETIDLVNSSLIIVKMPSNFPAFKDVRNIFTDKIHHDRAAGFGQIYEPAYEGDTLSLQIKDLQFWRQDNIHVGGSDLYGEFDVPTCYTYEWGGKGKCGSLLIAYNLPNPVIGIHVAGVASGARGFAEAVCKDMFKNLISDFSFANHLTVAQTGHPKLTIPGQFYPLGRVSGKLSHKVPTKTRIIPSLIQKDYPFPIRKIPAYLKPCEETGWVSPLVEGVRNHGDPMFPLPANLIEIAFEDYNSKIVSKNKPCFNPVCKLDEVTACAGIEGVVNYDPLEWNSSEGFPLINFRPWDSTEKNKRWLFDFDERGRCIGLKNILRQQINKDNELRKRKIIPDTIFTDCLKDQLTKPDKLTRVFSMAPVQLTIVERQLTLHFVASFMRNRLNLEHMIGCNPDSHEWHDMTLKLKEKGDNIISIDFSKFGDKLPADLIRLFFKIIINWNKTHGTFTEEELTMIEVICEEICNSQHLCLDFVYIMLGGQPSGNSMTVIVNTGVFALLIRIAWLEIMAETKFCGLTDFHKNVTYFSYGDDGIISVTDDVRDQFNGNSLHLFFKKYNLKMTNSSKSSEIIPYTPLSEAEFLKRGFLPHPTLNYLTLAPLSEESIEETPAWVWDDMYVQDINDQRYLDICLQVSQDACRNAFTRGPVYYNWFCNKLKQTWRKLNQDFPVDDWNSLNYKTYKLEEPLMRYSPNYKKNP